MGGAHAGRGGGGDVQQEVVCIKEHVYLWGYSLQCMHNDGAYHHKYCCREGVSLFNTALEGDSDFFDRPPYPRRK